MVQDSATVLTLLAVGAFVIDRVVTALMFLLSFVRLAPVPELAGDEALRVKSLRRHKLMYYVLAAIFAIGILLAFHNIRLLASLGISGQVPGESGLDPLLAFIVLVGGADGFSGLFTSSKGGAESAPQPAPLIVHGTLTLETPAQTAKQVAAD